MIPATENSTWSMLLALKQNLDELKEEFKHAVVEVHNEKFSVHINKTITGITNHQCIIVSKHAYDNVDAKHTFIQTSGLLDIKILSRGWLPESELAFLKLYLPYALLSITGKERKEPIAISHFAQSLDGKIATKAGSSQWIGNEENLIHSHRMRALCDGILIGTNTLKNDLPSLTVRKVTGKNPIKIVVGNSKSLCFDSLKKSKEKILYCTSDEDAHYEGVDIITVKSQNNPINCLEVLSQLFQQKIYSIYIEGGGQTASSFLLAKKLDIIQLHIAPLILGSGISNFQLPEIRTIDEGVAFKNHTFTPMGSHIMFSGEVKN